MTESSELPEFPIICQSCLGDNPYMRMTTQKNGQACKICTRPYTTHRWLPGVGMRYRRTEICMSCAKIKNVCQTCLLDLEYGLTTQIRDTMMGLQSQTPQGDANRRWYLRAAEEEMDRTGKPIVDYSKIDSIAKETLKKLAKTSSNSYIRSNKPKICPFWLKGNCKLGDECPLRHEMSRNRDKVHTPHSSSSSSSSSSTQALIPGQRILDRHQQEELNLQANTSTLFVSNLPETALSEERLRSHFQSYGEISSVTLSSAKKCAFVNFVLRESAEKALEENPSIMDGHTFQIRWGRSKPRTAGQAPVVSKDSHGRAKYEYSSMNPSFIS